MNEVEKSSLGQGLICIGWPQNTAQSGNSLGMASKIPLPSSPPLGLDWGKQRGNHDFTPTDICSLLLSHLPFQDGYKVMVN